jgi:chromosome segregation ATPase
MDKKVTKPLNIDKLKREIEKINIERDIQNILKRTNVKQELYPRFNRKKASSKNNKESKEAQNNNMYSYNSDNNKIRTELIQELEYLRQMYINRFLEESKKRTDTEAKKFIPLEGQEFKKKVDLVIKKAEEELNSYLQKLESVELKNKELATNINMIQTHKKILEAQLKDADISINKINKKYEIFNDLKPYYEELLKEFNINQDNYKSKDKILSSDMKRRREEAEEFDDEINERREKIKKLMEMKKNEDFDNRKLNEEISSDLREIELKNRNIEEEYNIKFMKIKQDIDSLYEYKEENIKIRNAIVSVYNLFYPKLYLERDLNTNPKGINLIKTDYTPKAYDTEEVVKYIYLMLKNSTEESSGLLLREIVSYCNMMLRNTVKGYDKSYYEPLSTVKQIESLITNIENQNEELKKIISSYSQTNDENQEKINKLELEIKRIEKMHEILHNKMRDFYKKNKKDLNNSESVKTEVSKENKDEKKESKKLTTEDVGSVEEHEDENNLKEEKIVKTEINKIEEKAKTKHTIGTHLKNDSSQGIQGLVEHVNRLFFYQTHLNMKPRETGVYIKAHRSMKQ